MSESRDIAGPEDPWGTAATLPLPPLPDGADVVGVRILADVEVERGALGIYAVDRTSQRTGEEVIVNAGAGRQAIAIDVASAATLFLRNGEQPRVRARLHDLHTVVRRRFDVSDLLEPLLPRLLKDIGARALDVIAAALTAREGRTVSRDEIGELTCARAPIALRFDTLWNDDLGRRILADTNDLIALLPTYDPLRVDPKNLYFGREFFATYLRQSAIRVYHCVRQLEAGGRPPGTVLEIGSLFGQFPLTLQRLGYRATAVDRYRTYAGAFDAYLDLLRREGVTVVETTREREGEMVSELGAFDAVLSMAVIEHIPHTPRLFLESLVSHVKPGGILVLDTPNIARYWNRKRLAAGDTIHQDIEKQYASDIPYEGHHREYTRAEMIWMLEQAGCCDVRARYFDYNLLQFSELWPDHLQALLAMIVDPSLADTILVSGTPAAGMERRHS